MPARKGWKSTNHSPRGQAGTDKLVKAAQFLVSGLAG